MSCTPSRAASSIAWQTLASVPPGCCRSGAIWTAAARTILFSGMVVPWRCGGSDGPGMDDQCVILTMQQLDIEHVERADRLDAFDQRRFTVPVQRLQCEAACIDLAAFFHELHQLLVEVEVAGEGFLAERGK